MLRAAEKQHIPTDMSKEATIFFIHIDHQRV